MAYPNTGSPIIQNAPGFNGHYNATPPTLTDGDVCGLQFDINGNLKTTATLSAAVVETGGVYNTSYPALTNGTQGEFQLDRLSRLITVPPLATGISIYSNVQGDFTATANAAAKTITFSAYASSILSATIATKNFAGAVIYRISSGGAVDILPMTNISFAANVLTLSGMDANFTAGDVVAVFVPGNDKAFDEGNDALRIGGNNGSGTTDVGNPVKIGGVYRSSNITLTNGQRGDLQMTANGFVRMDLATNLAGEDLTADKLVVEQRYTNFNISTATTTIVKSGTGYLDHMIIVGGTLGNVTVYDNTAGSGTVLLPTVTVSAAGLVLQHITFGTGLTIVTAAATIITGGYR